MSEANELPAAYPLEWPAGRPRTKHPHRSRFDVTFAPKPGAG